MPPLDWQPWHTAAFLDARQRQRVVLLVLETAWSSACASLHADVFTREDVRHVMHDVVPVRVDVDRRPDIADRYGLGEWPTVLLLTPDGEVLTGGTDIDPASFARQLRHAIDAAQLFLRRPRMHASDSHVAHQQPASLLPDEPSSGLDAVADEVWRARAPDSELFTHDEGLAFDALRFAVVHAMVGRHDDWLGAALATGHALRQGNADMATRLDEVTDAMRALACLAQADPDPVWREALDVRAKALARFRRADGHWRPWPDADLVLVDASARACLALAAAAVALETPRLAADAIDSLEVLAPAAYRRAAGVAHVLDARGASGPLRLGDAMTLGAALTVLDAWRDDDVYRDLAEEILRTAAARLRDVGGLYRDRVATMAGAGQVGRLATALHPLEGNALAARLLVALAPDDPAARVDAQGLLQALGPAVTGAGARAASVGLAWHALGPGGAAMGVW